MPTSPLPPATCLRLAILCSGFTLLAAPWTSWPARAASDGGAAPERAPDAGVAPEPAPDAAPAAPPARVDLDRPVTIEPLTVTGARAAGAAHVLRPRDLERLNLDNPEAVVKTAPGVYTRGEDGVGLRPNIGLRGTNPDRSKKVTLMEDGILFGPAPYSAPAAYYFPLITRMDQVRIVKGPGAVVYGPQTVGGAIDVVTRRIPSAASGGVDLAYGQYGYGKLHGHYGQGGERAGWVLEGVHLRSSGFKELDGGGDTGFSRNEWMWKGRYQLADNPGGRHELGLKLGYSDEDSRETYLGLTDADFRANPLRRYRASRLDHMIWQRTQLVASYSAELMNALSLNLAAYRHDFARTWRKFNRLGAGPVTQVLAHPEIPRNKVLLDVLTGGEGAPGIDRSIYVGPNRRTFVAEGVQATAAWRGQSGPLAHRLELGARLHYDRIDKLHTEQPFLLEGGVLTLRPLAGDPTRTETLTTANGRAWMQAFAAHVADAISWGRLTVSPGIRVELISSTVRDRMAGTQVDGDPQRVVIPGGGAYLAVTESLGVIAGAYHGFSPAAPGLPGTVAPEKSVNYEAGARWRSGKLRAEAFGFFNDYSNLTSICTFASGCVSDQVDTQYDAGSAHVWGVEAFAQADLEVGKGFVVPLLAAYTFTRTELLESFISGDPAFGMVEAGDELPYVPRHQANAMAALEHPRGSVLVGVSYVSAAREEAGQGPMVPAMTTDESLVLDLTVRAQLPPSGEVYLNLRNLLDARDLASHRPFGARPIAPRWIQLGTKWRF